MNMGRLMVIIFGFLTIVVTLAMAPSINTANVVIQNNANATSMIGMPVVDDFGAVLIIFGLLAMGGIFGVAGLQGKLTTGGMKDLLGVIGMVIVAIVALTFMDTIIDYVFALTVGTTGFALIMYRIIPLVIYLAIIAMTGWSGVSTYRRAKGKGKKAKPASAYGF